ncbi:MAG: hypothetical protein AAF975_07055, partial [Spirochaetota bacterium]
MYRSPNIAANRRKSSSKSRPQSGPVKMCFYLLHVFVFVFWACPAPADSAGPRPSSTTNSLPNSMNIAGAQAVGVLSQSSRAMMLRDGLSKNEEPNTETKKQDSKPHQFKFTADGRASELAIKNAAGEKLDIGITDLFLLNNDFFIAGLNNANFLVNKNNGRLYDFTSLGIPQRYSTNGHFGQMFFEDTSGNIYYASFKNVRVQLNDGPAYYTVKKIDISNPAAPTGATYFPEVFADFFVADKKGNVLLRDTADKNLQGFRGWKLKIATSGKTQTFSS